MSSSNKKAADRTAVAAAMRAEQAKREARRRILTVGGVALVMILIVGGAVLFSVLKNNRDTKKLEQAVTTLGQTKYGIAIGPSSAPHHVVIYEDFLCPVCGYLEANSHAQLAQAAVQGKVQVTYRPFDLLGQPHNDDYSGRAAGAFAVVMDKAGPEVAKKFHDYLYAHQPNEETGPFYTDDQLATFAADAGATGAGIRQAILAESGKSWVTAATAQAFGAGIQGTPTVFVDGKRLDSETTPIQTVTADLLSIVT